MANRIAVSPRVRVPFLNGRRKPYYRVYVHVPALILIQFLCWRLLAKWAPYLFTVYSSAPSDPIKLASVLLCTLKPDGHLLPRLLPHPSRQLSPTPPPRPTMPSMVVDDNGTQLSYIDSGIPARVAGAFIQHYITIFALHGFYFTNQTFEKVMAHASKANVRFVAISRRDYPGSTPFSPQDLEVFSSPNGEEKQAFLRDRGIEISTFICNFIEQTGLLPISSDGKSGGFALVGYGFGSVFALAAVANLDMLSVSFQTRWGGHMRGLLLHDPLAVSVGKPRLPMAWGPSKFPSFMLDKEWQTGYFKQWDMNARNLGMYSYDINPSLARLPTVNTMTEEEIARVFHDPIHCSSDIPLAISCGSQVKVNYKKACFDEEIRSLVPDMKIWVFSGDLSQPFSLPAFWAVENDNAARGGGFVNFRIVHSVNHYVLWVDPALTLRIYLEALGLK